MSWRRPAGAIRLVRETVAHALRAAGLEAGDGIVVACSHGPDSLALADAVLAVRRLCDLGQVTLVYVDHGLRAESASEGARVVAFAEAAGAPARVMPVRVERRGLGLEAAARSARYEALDRVAEEVGARFVLLGHTASDQAETVILRLLRGAGPAGLAGIPARRGRYLRPLLDLERAALDAYLKARELRASEDLSNRDPAFRRNRVRHDILPRLREENPALDDTLARTAASLRELTEALDWAVDLALAALPSAPLPTDGGVTLPVTALAALPPAITKRLLLRQATAFGVSLETKHLEAALRLLRAPSGERRRLALPGLVLLREGDTLAFVLGKQPSPHGRASKERESARGESGGRLDER